MTPPKKTPTRRPYSFKHKINRIACADINMRAASYLPCKLEKLPGTLKEILDILPNGERRDFIKDYKIGKPKFLRGVEDFDLTKTFFYYDDHKPKVSQTLAFIKYFFKGHTVETVQRSLGDGGNLET